MAQAALARECGADHRAQSRTDAVPIPNTADSGYFSEQAVATWKRWDRSDIATGRQKHHEKTAPLRRENPPPQQVPRKRYNTNYACATASCSMRAQAHRRASIRQIKSVVAPQVLLPAWRR